MPRNTVYKLKRREKQKKQAKRTRRTRSAQQTRRKRLRGGLSPQQRMRTRGNRAIQGAYALNRYANQGPEGKAAAAAELLEHILANRKVQDQLAQVAAAGTGIALKVAGDVVPQLLTTAQKVSGKVESAGTNLIEGVLDIVPVVDQIEGVGQGLVAIDRGIAAATQTGVGVVKAATETVNDLGETASAFQQNVAALSSTADQVIENETPSSIAAPSIPTIQEPKFAPSPPRPQQPKSSPQPKQQTKRTVASQAKRTRSQTGKGLTSRTIRRR